MAEKELERILYYQYQIYSAKSEDIYASIHLHGAEGSIATAFFLQSDSLDIASQKDRSGDRQMYYRKSELTDIVDMLRHEKPVYFRMDEHGMKRISTGLEAEGRGT